MSTQPKHRKPSRRRDRLTVLAPAGVWAGLLTYGVVVDPLLALIVCVAGWIALDVAERLHAAAKHLDRIVDEEAPR